MPADASPLWIRADFSPCLLKRVQNNSSGNCACVLGKKRGLWTTFWTFICLLFVTNVFEMEEKVCPNQNAPPLFPFCPLAASYTPPSLQNPTNPTRKPTSGYLHLLVSTFLFYLQMCKLTQSWLNPLSFCSRWYDGGRRDGDMDI